MKLFKKDKKCKGGYCYTCKQCINDIARKIPIAPPGQQFCRKCLKFKKLEAFEKCKACTSGYRYRCKECRRRNYNRKGPCKQNPSWFKAGEKHPYFVDGDWRARSKIGKNKRFQRLRGIVLKRDDYKCVRCGSTDKLHVHHVVPLRDNIELAYDTDNLITVCPKCHVNEEGLK